jgi:hypothetical protein
MVLQLLLLLLLDLWGPIAPFSIFQKNSTIKNKCKRYSHIFLSIRLILWFRLN